MGRPGTGDGNLGGGLKVLDLFSGIGGFSLGLERAGMETVAFCEWDAKARQVLAKHWPEVPCYHDDKDLTKERLDQDGITDIRLICGGYPCQPFSTAGKRQGEDDDRHLWPEVLRLVQTIRPTWVLCENVAGHISMGLDDVLSDLEGQGYAARTFVIPACAVSAPHRRDRVWTVAHANSTHPQRSGIPFRVHEEHANADCGGSNTPGVLADTERGGRQGQGKPINASNQAQEGKGKAVEPINGGQRQERCVKPGLGGVFDGLSYWLDEPRERVKAGVPNRAPRLKALGNAVVPQIPEMIGRAILEAHEW